MTWARIPFAQAFTTISDRGRRVKQKQYLSHGAVPVVDQGAALVGGFTDDGDFVVGAESPMIVFGDHTRRVKYVDFPFAVGADGVKLLKPREDLHPKFAYWYLCSIDLADRGYGRHFALLRDVDVPVPSPDEQRRIVDLLEDHLSRLGAAEAGLRTSLARSEAMLTSGLWHTTHGLDASKTVELQSIGEVRLGRQRSPKNHRGDRMRPYLRAANVGWDELRLDDVKEMQFTEAEERTYRLESGDIILTEASGSPAEVGKSAIYRGEPSAVCFQNTLLRVRCHSDDPEFVQKYLLAEARAGRLMPQSRGVGINHLGRARLANLSIDIPPEAQQTSAVETCRALVDEVGRLKSTIEAQSKRSSALRKSLLAAAFSGRLTGSPSGLSAAQEVIDA